jgi:hypothetical protein
MNEKLKFNGHILKCLVNKSLTNWNILEIRMGRRKFYNISDNKNSNKSR